MIQMAENRGLFGRSSSPSSKTKGSKSTRKKQEEIKQPHKNKRRIKDLEVTRIAAPTHAFLRHTKDCDIERCCRCRLDEDEFKERPSIYKQWWSETTRHIISLRSNLIKNKVIPTKKSKIDAKFVVDSFVTNYKKVDEIVAKSSRSSIPIFPKLKLTREHKVQKVQMQLPVTTVKFS